VSRIQVDSESAQHLGIPTHRLRATQTTILWFQRYWYAPNGDDQTKIANWGPKILSDMLCDWRWYFVQFAAETIMDSSQLNVSFTLHQVMKYIDRDGKIRTLIVERHPLKGEENYLTDSLLYIDSPEMNENP